MLRVFVALVVHQEVDAALLYAHALASPHHPLLQVTHAYLFEQSDISLVTHCSCPRSTVRSFPGQLVSLHAGHCRPSTPTDRKNRHAVYKAAQHSEVP